MAKEASTDDLSFEVTAAMLKLFNKVIQQHRTPRVYDGQRFTMVEAQLCFLIATGSEVTPSDLADVGGVSRAAVSQVLTRLKAQGYVISVRRPGDGRSQTLAVTESGQKVANAIGAVFDDMRSKVFTGNAAELRSFLRLFESVDAYLESVVAES